jgi:hypothetical protein
MGCDTMLHLIDPAALADIGKRLGALAMEEN